LKTAKGVAFAPHLLFLNQNQNLNLNQNLQHLLRGTAPIMGPLTEMPSRNAQNILRRRHVAQILIAHGGTARFIQAARNVFAIIARRVVQRQAVVKAQEMVGIASGATRKHLVDAPQLRRRRLQ
jgi:hypothetical protein